MTRTYTVPDISCDHCKRAIESELGTMQGIDRVAVDVEARTVVIDGAASDEAVRAALVEVGYTPDPG